MAAASDTRQLQLQISASAELLIRNLKTADNAVADFQRQTDARLSSIDSRFAALGKLKGKLSGLDTSIGLGDIAGAATGVGEQLLAIMAPVIADDNGRATIVFKPYIRLVPADGAPIEVKRPYAIMSMSDPKNGWVADVGQQYDVPFQCEEAF